MYKCILACCFMLCFLCYPQKVRADADKYNFDKGNYDKVSSEALEKQTKGLESSLGISQSQAEGWARKVDEIKIEEQKEQKIKDELTKNKEKLEKCTNGGSKCSSALVEKLKEKIEDAEDFIANSDDNGRRDYQKAQYERNMNYHLQEAAKTKAKLAAAQKEIEKRKSPQPESLSVEPEPEAEESIGVLPPVAPVQEAVKTEAPKQVDAIGMVTSEGTGSSNAAADSDTSAPSPSAKASMAAKPSSGGLFATLIQSGIEIFKGMREIIFAVAGFGIMAVAIGGFFGNLNWKWLSAIIIGLMVTATASALINYMVDYDAVTDDMITDTLISAR